MITLSTCMIRIQTTTKIVINQLFASKNFIKKSH